MHYCTLIHDYISGICVYVKCTTKKCQLIWSYLAGQKNNLDIIMLDYWNGGILDYPRYHRHCYLHIEASVFEVP